jgi:hypothetical protein
MHRVDANNLSLARVDGTLKYIKMSESEYGDGSAYCTVILIYEVSDEKED